MAWGWWQNSCLIPATLHIRAEAKKNFSEAIFQNSSSKLRFSFQSTAGPAPSSVLRRLPVPLCNCYSEYEKEEFVRIHSARFSAPTASFSLENSSSFVLLEIIRSHFSSFHVLRFEFNHTLPVSFR